MAEETINIMADFGNGPYAWKKQAGDGGHGVGSNIADATCGLSHVIGTSQRLDDDFARWVIDFERGYDDPEFDWDLFHMEGLLLTTRLKDEVGNRFTIFYCAPSDDPVRGKLPPFLVKQD